jgi:hypothetical protein
MPEFGDGRAILSAFLAREPVFTHQVVPQAGHRGHEIDGFVRKDGLVRKVMPGMLDSR